VNRGLVLALALVCCLPLAAQAQSLQTPMPEVTIRLSNFAFTPQLVQLRVGVPVRLHLVNDSGGGHSFSAPAFFAAGSYPSGAPPRDGKVELAGHASADITLVPRTDGTYKVECSHFLHSLFGMTGTIVVSR